MCVTMRRFERLGLVMVTSTGDLKKERNHGRD